MYSSFKALITVASLLIKGKGSTLFYKFEDLGDSLLPKY